MAVVQCSQTVSVAHRPTGHNGLGNNLTVKMSVVTDGEFSFDPYLERVKSRLDHRCLFEDEPRFREKPSSLEAIAEFVAEDLFQQSLPNARWLAVEVSEQDRFRCMIEPGSTNLRLTIHYRNLTLETRGPLDRAQVMAEVDRVFTDFHAIAGESEQQWGERLFITLKKCIPNLCEVRVDLGRHRSIRLAPSPSRLR